MATAETQSERRSSLFDDEHPSGPLAASWRKQIRLASDFKLKQFDIDAHEALKFYNSDHAFLWDSNDPRSFLAGDKMRSVSPDFTFAYNVMAEVVQIFGPTLYHRNPYRQVNPREPIEIPESLFVDPQLVAAFQAAQAKLMPQQPPGSPPPQQPPQPNPQVQMLMASLQQQLEQQQQKYAKFQSKQQERFARDRTESQLLQRLLNYTPNALDLKSHCRRCVDEALITGLSWMWTELYSFPGSECMMPGSFWVSSADIVLDPDASCMSECMYMARRSVHPTWRVEDKFRKKRGSVKGNLESLAKQSQYGVEDWAYSMSKRGGDGHKDLVVYWEIYSKMGMGGRIKGVRSEIADMLEDCGDYCYLAVADGYKGVLSIPDKVMATEDVDEIWPYVQWPVSYWADGTWPATPLYYHEVPNQIYPMGHLKPAIGEVRFIDWVMSFLAKKVRTVCDDILGCVKGVADDFRTALSRSGDDLFGYTMVEIEQAFGKDVREMLSYVQAPPFHGDIWKMVAAVAERIERRLGLSELAYGQSDRQMRSSKEAEVKQQNYSVRPEDMQNKTEDCMTMVARKEAIAAREHLTPDDVAPILGSDGAMLWETYMMDRSLDSIMREFDYRIEANSIRKPNRDRDAANMQNILQWMLPLLEKMVGVNAEKNMPALNSFIDHVLQTLDLSTADMPKLFPPDGNQPNPKMQEVEGKLKLMEQELQLRQAEAQAAMGERAQEAQVRQATAQIEEARAQTELTHAQAEIEHDQAAAAADLAQGDAEHRLSLRQQQEKHDLQQKLLRQKNRQKQSVAP